ncbi:hypothetical protein OG730_34875 [Streptomyces sp. NBC_01298]|uniref:hypothetical protein n=1 Tax=Streptomyces sp. NBC_01298 TaxID=2903817 RepID=UPI002E1680A3|nr:hypothetical protein OG730_34875 [Streptomyces sp. NBC_01298]
MSNPTAAAIAAEAARHAIENPSLQNLQTAHAMLQGAQAEGATNDEFKAAADKLR